ncbi:MAG: hypothetical protein WC919_01090 [Candidatus Paceibacterota bacterium]|jgi:hypothetical protein
MAKKKKPSGTKKLSCGTFTNFKQEFSYDTDAVIFLSALQHYIRMDIEELAVQISGENKMCIPRSTMEKAARQLGLGAWLDKWPEEKPGG